MKDSAYELGERLPSGVSFCFAAPSLRTIGALGDEVRGVADAECVRSAWTGVCVEGASDMGAGDDPPDGGGASGVATDAIAWRLRCQDGRTAGSMR